MLSTLFILWFSVIPFVIWKAGYEGPKLIFFLIGSIPLIVFWIVKVFQNKFLINLTKRDLLFTLWLFILSVSSIFGLNPFASFLGGDYRHQGVLFFLALFLVGKTIKILDNTSKEFLSKVIALSILGEGLIVILQFLSRSLYLGKPLGTIGEANAVAGYIAVGSLFVFSEFKTFFWGFLLSLPIILTNSRAGFLSFFSTLGIVTEGFVSKWKNIFFFGLCLAAISSIFLITSEKSTSPFEDRGTIWKFAVQNIVKRPILGYGAETETQIFDSSFKGIGMPLFGLSIDRAHNLFLDVGLESGLVGLLVFILWLYHEFVVLSAEKKYAFISLLAFAFFQPLSIVHWLLFFAILNI